MVAETAQVLMVLLKQRHVTL